MVALWLAALAVPVAGHESSIHLSDPRVSPRVAAPGAQIAFAVTYQDQAGRDPDWVRVVIDGRATEMSRGAGQADTGIRYATTLSLHAGRHGVLFVARTNGTRATISGGDVRIEGGGADATPTAQPTPKPTPTPTATPKPTAEPPADSTPRPEPTPTPKPTAEPTHEPTPAPTPRPTATARPTSEPTHAPTPRPTTDPTATPRPTVNPTANPTRAPEPTPTPGHDGSTPTRPPGSTPTPTPAHTSDPGGGAGGSSGSTPGATGTAVPVPTPPAADPSPPLTAGLIKGGSNGSGGGNDGSTTTGGNGGSGSSDSINSVGSLKGASRAQGGLSDLIPFSDAFGGPGNPARLLPVVTVTSTVTTIVTAFLLFGRRRREEEQPGSDAELAAAAGSPYRVLPASLVPSYVGVDPGTGGTDIDLPRWRRPSLLAARASNPAAAVGAPRQCLVFDPEDVAPTQRERNVIRYRIVKLLDQPDELLGNTVGQLDAGDEVEVIESRGTYRKVLTPEGRTGWIHRMVMSDLDDTPEAESGDGPDLLSAYLASRSHR